MAMSVEVPASELLVAQSPDALIFADRDGVIRVWNHAAERIFGFTAAEALGQSLDLIIPDRFREAHWKGFDAALEAGVTKYENTAMPTRGLHKTEDRVYVELTFAIVKDESGSVIGAMANARDITEKWLREREAAQARREQQQS